MPVSILVIYVTLPLRAREVIAIFNLGLSECLNLVFNLEALIFNLISYERVLPKRAALTLAIASSESLRPVPNILNFSIASSVCL